MSGIKMLYIPPRGSYPEFWINPAHIVSVYYAGCIVCIELRRSTSSIVYSSEEDAEKAAEIFISKIEDPDYMSELPKAVDGSIRVH